MINVASRKLHVDDSMYVAAISIRNVLRVEIGGGVFPFGNSTVVGTSANTIQFAGRENDGTGLVYFRARYYSPTLSRFISEDPVAVQGSPNLYTYADNDPISMGDPLGLSTVNITIVRTYQNDQAITGTLTVSVDGGPIQFQGYSLEPSGVLSGSYQPIPVGLYPATVFSSPKRGGEDVVLLGNTAPRTRIEIHPGSRPKDTMGCILPGTRVGSDSNYNNFVGGSRIAFNQIMSIISATEQADQENGEQTTIVVSIGQLIAQGGGPQ